MNASPKRIALVLCTFAVAFFAQAARAQSPDLTLQNTTHSSGATSYQATNSITAQNNFIVNGSASVTFTAGQFISLKPGFQATAGSGATFRASIGAITVTETISMPSVPSGPTTGSVGANLTYTASGAASNLGHAVQYRFDWGDGMNSGWLPTGTLSASHAWTAPGTYLTTVQARCTTETGIVSALSSQPVVIAAPDLTLTVSTPTASVVSNSAGVATYGVSVQWNPSTFNGQVSFAVSGVPPGATAAFSPPTSTGSGSTQLTISNVPWNALGDFPLTITASGSNGFSTIARTRTATLKVQDFALTVSPSSTTIPCGLGTTTFQVQVKPLNGFTGYVVLSSPGVFEGTGIAVVNFSGTAYADGINTATQTATVQSNYLTCSPHTVQFTVSGRWTAVPATYNVIRLAGGEFAINASSTPAVTITTDPVNLSVTVDGSESRGPVDAHWQPGSSHTIATSVVQTDATGAIYDFESWSNGGGISHSVTAPGSPSMITARFRPRPPSVISVTPSSGTGSTQVFTAVYSHPSGAGAISQARLLIQETPNNSVNQCVVRYDPGPQALYLLANDGLSFLGPIAAGAGDALSNAQCTLSGASTGFIAGNTLSVDFAVIFTTAFTGTKQLLLQAAEIYFGKPLALETWIVPTSTPPGTQGTTPGTGAPPDPILPTPSSAPPPPIISQLLLIRLFQQRPRYWF